MTADASDALLKDTNIAHIVMTSNYFSVLSNLEKLLGDQFPSIPHHFNRFNSCIVLYVLSDLMKVGPKKQRGHFKKRGVCFFFNLVSRVQFSKCSSYSMSFMLQLVFNLQSFTRNVLNSQIPPSK